MRRQLRARRRWPATAPSSEQPLGSVSRCWHWVCSNRVRTSVYCCHPAMQVWPGAWGAPGQQEGGGRPAGECRCSAATLLQDCAMLFSNAMAQCTASFPDVMTAYLELLSCVHPTRRPPPLTPPPASPGAPPTSRPPSPPPRPSPSRPGSRSGRLGLWAEKWLVFLKSGVCWRRLRLAVVASGVSLPRLSPQPYPLIPSCRPCGAQVCPDGTPGRLRLEGRQLGSQRAGLRGRQGGWWR